MQEKPKKKEIIYINWIRSVIIYAIVYVHVLVALNRSMATSNFKDNDNFI